MGEKPETFGGKTRRIDFHPPLKPGTRCACCEEEAILWSDDKKQWVCRDHYENPDGVESYMAVCGQLRRQLDAARAEIEALESERAGMRSVRVQVTVEPGSVALCPPDADMLWCERRRAWENENAGRCEHLRLPGRTANLFAGKLPAGPEGIKTVEITVRDVEDDRVTTAGELRKRMADWQANASPEEKALICDALNTAVEAYGGAEDDEAEGEAM